MNLIPTVPDEAETIMVQFIRGAVKDAGFQGVVLGLSGGLDSALSMDLASRALGPENVKPIHMPYGDIDGESRELAEEAARSSGCDLRTIDITQMVDSIPLEMDQNSLANAQARVRMICLYALANRGSQLVMGTSNKSELLLGYYTKYGDGGTDLNPLGDLYKTQLRIISKNSRVPLTILSRPPSAGLIEGQTDEEDLRLPYPIIDQILAGHLRGMTPGRILENVNCSLSTNEENARAGFEPPIELEEIQRIVAMVRNSLHKRNPIPIPKISTSTIGCDIRERW